jgi:hypothetical protein
MAEKKTAGSDKPCATLTYVKASNIHGYGISIAFLMIF